MCIDVSVEPLAFIMSTNGCLYYESCRFLWNVCTHLSGQMLTHQCNWHHEDDSCAARLGFPHPTLYETCGSLWVFLNKSTICCCCKTHESSTPPDISYTIYLHFNIIQWSVSKYLKRPLQFRLSNLILTFSRRNYFFKF